MAAGSRPTWTHNYCKWSELGLTSATIFAAMGNVVMALLGLFTLVTDVTQLAEPEVQHRLDGLL